MSFVSSITQSIEKRWTWIATAGAFLLVATAGSYFWSEHKKAREEVASQALNTARAKLEADLAAWQQKQEKPAKPKSKQPARAEMPTYDYMALSVDQEFGSSIAEMKKVAEEHAGTRSAYFASLELGKLYYDHHQYQSAATWFEKAAESGASRLEESLAWASAGYAQENLKDWKAALLAFERALNVKSLAVRGEILLAKARVQAVQGNKEQARATYEIIKKELADTSHAKTAETQLKSL